MKIFIFQIFCALEFLYFEVFVYGNCVESLSEDDEVSEISHCAFNDFRIPELLRLKKSLEKISTDGGTCGPMANCASGESAVNLNHTRNMYSDVNQKEETLEAGTSLNPSAMALKAEGRGHATADYHPWQPEEKPSKLQTLFQISITALAFLSFGGYLLCLIVQAIKSKGTTYFHPVATTKTNTNSGVKRIKIYRRSRRRTIEFTSVSYHNLNTLDSNNHIYEYFDRNYHHSAL